VFIEQAEKGILTTVVGGGQVAAALLMVSTQSIKWEDFWGCHLTATAASAEAKLATLATDAA
jgi:hypothetical protein